MGLSNLKYTYVVLQKSGRTITIAWNDKSKKIVMVRPGSLSSLMYKDGPTELSSFLMAGWKEKSRGDWSGMNEQIQAMREVHRKKLSSRARVSKQDGGVPVPKETPDK